MLLRTRDKPVFLTQGSPIKGDLQDPNSGYSDEYSNGRRHRGDQRFDRDVAVLVERFKAWQLYPIKLKRENLEYKIKRALDYSDQLMSEIALIDLMLSTDSGQDVDSQVSKIFSFAGRTGAANVVSNLLDIFGLGIGRIGDPTAADDLEDEQSKDLRIG